MNIALYHKKIYVTDMQYSDSQNVFKNFNFFKPSHNVYSVVFFLALLNGEIVGVAKLGNSGNYGKNVWHMCYIDINTEHKGRGLAKELFKLINEWSKTKTESIFAGIEEFEGKSIISEVAQRFIKDCYYCANYNELAEYESKLLSNFIR